MALGALLSPCVGWRVSWVSAAAVWAGCWVPVCCVFCGRAGCSLVGGSPLSCVAGRVSLLLAHVGCLAAAACVASPALRRSFGSGELCPAAACCCGGCLPALPVGCSFGVWVLCPAAAGRPSLLLWVLCPVTACGGCCGGLSLRGSVCSFGVWVL